MCVRCESALESWLRRLSGNRLSAALTLAALVLYIPAVMLPFLRIEQLGQAHESSLLVGVKTLFTEGQVLVGVIVLVFSIVLPLLKLSALLFLSQRRWQLAERHKALTYRLVEQLGRWGMLDVLLVAVMVAFIKLGGLVEFHAGPGIVAFTLFVLVSLLASATFDPHVLWDEGVMLAAKRPALPSGKKNAAASTPADQSPVTSGSDSLPTAIVPDRSRRWWNPYLVWLIPILAAIVVGWMVRASLNDRGRLIHIAFADGHGIEAGDELRYHGIVAGDVESVMLNDRLTGVTVAVRLTPESDQLASEGTRFWIVRPQADLTGIAGLETVVGSKYLTLLPGPTDAPRMSRFEGLEDPPLPDLEFPGGIEIVLQSPEALGLRSGLGIFYRSIRIGGVIDTGLASDGSAVETRAYIRPDFRHLIRQRTVFWNAGGIHVVGGLTELAVHIGTVETMIRGGIGMSVPPDPGDEVAAGHRFELYDRPEKEWLKWQPSVGDHRIPPPVDVPRLVPATLSWTHDGVINRQRSRTGWVLPVDKGWLGPRDLLTIPDDTIEGTASLMVNGEAVDLTQEIQTVNEGTVILGSSEVTSGDSKLRAFENPEDGFLVTGEQGHLFIAAGRYQSRDDGRYELDPSLPIGPEHHGGVIVAAADGALIGCVTVRDETAIVWPVTNREP